MSWIIFCNSVSAELFVIVNKNNTVEAMTKNEVAGIYLGKYQAFQNGIFAIPIDQSTESNNRATFYFAITGRNLAYINAYWARNLLAGRSTPPKLVQNDTDVLNLVKQNKNAIGYIDSAMSEEQMEGVKVVLRLD